jgi:hypothetical protein
MTKTIEIKTAESFASRLFEAKDYPTIEAICEEIKVSEGFDRKSGKTWSNTLAPLNKLINTFPIENLKVEENAFVQIKEDGSQWMRHYYFKAVGIADINWNGQDGINTKAGEKKLEGLTEKKEILVNQYLETACKLLKSDHPHELAVGLIAVSGRRPIEILALADFTKKKSIKDMPAGVLDKAKNLNIDYYVNFSGQAKRGDHQLDADEKLKYPIGLLVPVDAFIAAFNKLRSLPECLEITAMVNRELAKGNTQEKIDEIIENRRGNSLRRVVQNEFGFIPAKEDEKNVSNKSLRAVYVKLITDRDCPKTIDDLLWASRSIGHFIDTESPDKNKLMDLITTLNYRYYYTNETTPFINLESASIEKDKSYRCYESDYNSLEELKNDLGFSNQSQCIRYILTRANKADKLESKIEKLQSKIKELEAMKTQTITEIKEVEIIKEVPVEVVKEVEVIKEVATPLTINSDLQELIKNEVALQVKEALKDVKSEVKIEVAPEVKEYVKPTAAKTDDTDWEGMSHEELWKTKKQGASTEKIRRSFVAVGFYNGEVANGDNLPKIAITNQVLRDLSRCNGQLVGDWMRDHADEIISHNENFGVFTKSGQLESYANRQIGVDKVRVALEEVNNKFLDGQALNKK